MDNVFRGKGPVTLFFRLRPGFIVQVVFSFQFKIPAEI